MPIEAKDHRSERAFVTRLRIEQLQVWKSVLLVCILAVSAQGAAPDCGTIVNNAQTCTYTRSLNIWVGTVSVIGAQASDDDYVESTDPVTPTLAVAIFHDSRVDARVRKLGSLAIPGSSVGDIAWVQDPPKNLPAQTNLIAAFNTRVTALNSIYGSGSVALTASFQNHAAILYSLVTWDTVVAGVATHNLGVASVTIFEQDLTWTAPASKGPGGFAGSMAQVASAGGWGTLFTLVNTGATSSAAHLDFFDNDGAPLALPISVTPGGSATPMTSVDQTLNPGASLFVDSTGDNGQPLSVGWAQLLATGSVSGFGIFRFPAAKWEAVVPLETRTANSYIVAFDNTASLATGVAVANITAMSAVVTVTIRNDAGTSIGAATIDLPGQGHTTFMLNSQYPVTAGKRGTVEFRTTNSGVISVLGLRANGSALTTLPVLANVPSGGGSIAHVTFGGGFNSLIYLVNTGASAAAFTLSFFDDHGSPLNVSLFLLNPGTPAAGTSLTRTLAPGALLAINVQPRGVDTVVGSAQLTTTGTVGGFEIFQWTTFGGQEATVPIETRTPNSFLLAFDNTNGLTTGVALANRAAAAATVTVKLDDSGGNLLQTNSIPLPARGHTSFLLPELLPFTENQRGTVEFVVPANGSLSVIGLRAKSDGTLTTIPILVK
jgi:hypothetical protein